MSVDKEWSRSIAFFDRKKKEHTIINVTITIDRTDLEAQAIKAYYNKNKKSKDGALTIKFD